MSPFSEEASAPDVPAAMAFWAALHIIGLVENRRVVERELERVRVVAQAETGRGEVPAAIARAVAVERRAVEEREQAQAFRKFGV